MAEYTYQCTICSHVFTANHSIKERLTRCPKCQVEDTLERVPQKFRSEVESKAPHEGKQQVGQVVKDSIKEQVELLQKEKEELKGRLWSPSK